MKKRRGMSLFLIITLFFIAFKVFSYDNLVVHPDLSKAAASVFNQQADRKLSQEQIGWIAQGSIDEDADPRYLNHFYDPTTGKGIEKFSSAKQWSLNQDGFIGISGDYSESAIINNYKNGDFKRAFQGIGHILHLIQDMSVPAHTRNDPHADGDPYEKWAEQYGRINLSKVKFKEINNLDDAFDLAVYSHNYFYSKDNIDISNIDNYIIAKELIDGEQRGYLINIVDNLNYRIAYLKNPDGFKPVYQINNDFKLNLDYWNLLHPKAVGYSAGVIDYFIKKFSEIDQNIQEQKLSRWEKIKNYLSKSIDNAEYTIGDSISFVSGNAKEEFTLYKKAGKKLGQNLGFFNESAKETTVKAVEKTIEKTNKAVDKAMEVKKSVVKKTAKTSQKITNDASEKSKETAEKGKVLGKKIINDIKKQQEKFALIEPAKSEENNEKNKPEIKIDILDKKSNPSKNMPVFVLQNPDDFMKKTDSTTSTTTTSTKPLKKEKTLSIAIKKGPDEFSNQLAESFELESADNDVSYKCKLDDDEWKACSASTTFNSLAEGIHSFSAQAFDEDGNTSSPASFAWLTDFTAPTSTITINLEYPETGFVVNWLGQDQPSSSSLESGISYFELMQRIDSDQWQDWQTATTATSSIFIQPVEPGQKISFKIRARDNAKNLSDWSNAYETKIASKIIIKDVVISEIRTVGTTAKDEFIELYNPTDQNIYLDSYKLKKKTSGGKEETILVSDFGPAIIYSHGYFLVAHPDYDGNIKPDLQYAASYGIADDNTVILYKNNQIIDKVGFGNAKDFEKMAAMNPENSRSIERKSFASSTEESMNAGSLDGNGYDSDNNSEDFILRGNSDPQNSKSEREQKITGKDACSYLALDNEGAAISQTLTIENNPYCIIDHTEVKSEAVITINPGVILKFEENDGLIVKGELIILGEPGLPVIMTSICDDNYGAHVCPPGKYLDTADWHGVEAIDGGRIEINYSIIKNGGNYWDWPLNNIFVPYLLIGGAISANNGTVKINNSLFYTNAVGVEVTGQSEVSIKNSDFMFNRYGLINNSTSTINVINNHWANNGYNQGPYNSESNITGIGNEVAGDVIFSPWSTSRYTDYALK